MRGARVTPDFPLWAQGSWRPRCSWGPVAWFALIGARPFGMLRFPDFFMRLHAPTKASTLSSRRRAAGLEHRGATGRAGPSSSWHELLITLFVFVTAPVSANLMAKAALRLDPRLRPPPPPAGERR